MIILIVSLPSIVTESVFGLNGTQPDPNATLESSYSEMSDVVSEVIDNAYDLSLNRVRRSFWTEVMTMTCPWMP